MGRSITWGAKIAEAQRGERGNNWRGEDISYRAAHKRVTRERGPASGCVCVDCGGAAAEWSLIRGLGTHESSQGPYSTVVDAYEPRCKRCHVAYDRYECEVCAV
jgi:hypothetical protein